MKNKMRTHKTFMNTLISNIDLSSYFSSPSLQDTPIFEIIALQEGKRSQAMARRTTKDRQTTRSIVAPRKRKLQIFYYS